MFARRTAEGILQHISGYAAIFAEPTTYVALLTTAPTDDTGTGAVEVTGGAYARVQISLSTTGTVALSSNQLTALAATGGIVAGQLIFGANIPAATTVVSISGTTVTMSANATAAASAEAVSFSSMAAASTGTDPTTEANTAAIAFPTATASWGTVVAFGLYDAATAGNLLAWDWLGNYQWLPTTVSLASPGVFTAHANGYAASDPVVFTDVFGGTAPTSSGGALGSNNVSLVVTPTADTFTLTTAGTAVNTSTTGSGMIRKIVQQSVPSGVQPSFAAGQLVLQAA